MNRLNLKVEELEERIAPSNGVCWMSGFATSAPGVIGEAFSANASSPQAGGMGNDIGDFIANELADCRTS